MKKMIRSMTRESLQFGSINDLQLRMAPRTKMSKREFREIKKGIEYYEAQVLMCRKIRDFGRDNDVPNLVVISEPDLSAYLNELGRCHFCAREYDKADEFYREALQIANESQLPMEHLPAVLFNIGDLYCCIDRLEDAIEQYLKCAGLIKEMKLEDLCNSGVFDDIRVLFFVCHDRIGNWQYDRGNLQQACGSLLESIGTSCEFAGEYQDDEDFNLSVINNLSLLADCYGKSGDADKNASYLLKKNEAIKKLFSAYPGNYLYLLMLIASYDQLLELFHKSGRQSEEVKYYLEYIDMFDSIKPAFLGENTAFLNKKSCLLHAVGQLYKDSNEIEKAKEFFSKAVEVFRHISAAEKDNNRFINSLAISLTGLGDCHSDLFKTSGSNLETAADFYREAIRLTEDLIDKDRDNEDYGVNLLVMLHAVQALYFEAEKYTRALFYSRKLITACRIEILKHPTEPEFKRRYSQAFRWQAYIYEGLGNMDAAIECFMKYLSVCRELVRDFPGEPEHIAFLCQALEIVGDLYQYNNPKTAYEHYLEGLALLKGLADKGDEYRYMLLKKMDDISVWLIDNGKFRMSYELYKEKCSLLRELIGKGIENTELKEMLAESERVLASYTVPGKDYEWE